MKKLFLASFACVTLDLIKELLPHPPSELKAAFIPTAADPYQDTGFVSVDREKLVSMGFQVTDVDLKVAKGHDLETALQDVDVILVAGGNTFYLLDHVRKSGFDTIVKKLIDKGVIYIGSSAGSALCCPTIEGTILFDDPHEAPDLKDYTGLNLFEKVIIPHAQKEKYDERIRMTIEEMKTKGYESLTLTDNEAVLVVGSEWRVVRVSETMSS